jgi:hypothetical protein
MLKSSWLFAHLQLRKMLLAELPGSWSSLASRAFIKASIATPV